VPVIILASNIRLLLTDRVDKKADVFLVLSVYICDAPMPQRPIMISITSGTPKPVDTMGGTLESLWCTIEIEMAIRIAEKKAAAMKYTKWSITSLFISVNIFCLLLSAFNSF
jgi:hypothetical protein